MRSEVLLAVITKAVDGYIAKALETSAIRGPRGFKGQQGDPGVDGKSFVWSEHESAIRSIIRECALKFEDLTLDQIEALRGPKGKDGRDGRDGKDGESATFSFEEHREAITGVISEELKSLAPSLKLKFSDLSLEEISKLRGPRGQKGRPGKDFVFEEHREYFDSLKSDLKLKFSDLSKEEIEALKLKFSDLTEDDLSKIKLKFSDLSEEDKISIRGPRGQRGRQGRDGIDGERGPVGPRGPIGPQGLTGLQGTPGMDGVDGKDAPTIDSVRIKEYPDYQFSIEFYLSDGSLIETNPVSIPKPTNKVIQQLLGVSNNDSSGKDPGLLENILCDSTVFVGAAVRLDYVAGVVTAVNAMADSYYTSNVLGLVESKIGDTLCNIRVSGVTKDIFNNLDITMEYYLSDVSPGVIVPYSSCPSTSGSVLVKIGQPLSGSQILYSRGDLSSIGEIIL